MAGKGGGAWKVAYADFVTAMMAFFLVMWIVAQDRKLKEGVSHYFIDPMGYNPIGLSSDSGKRGALTDSEATGVVPESDSVAAGMGRKASADAERAAFATRIVSQWLKNDRGSFQYWHEQARETRKVVASKKPLSTETDSIDAEAALNLAAQMKNEIARNVPEVVDGLYRDLIHDSLNCVKWDDVAEDVLTHD